MPKPHELDALYKDSQRCARLVGLSYSTQDDLGFTRRKHGKGFRFFDDSGSPITDADVKKRIAELVIPPAWQEVWICPEPNGHILVTGVDEKGRKQYIYHPKWRQVRDLLKFYRLITFGHHLPAIRQAITQDLNAEPLSYRQVIATMLWVMDSTYIRVGNDTYFHQNESVGLTTLSDHNVVIAGDVVTFSFKGKSGKDHTIVFEDKQIARAIAECKAIKGPRLFQYRSDDGSFRAILASDINTYLQDVAQAPISAKDFRTWGGTLMAFHHLQEEQESDKRPEKVAVEAIDAAADVLGNTRAVARSSYVHPHLVEVFTHDLFRKYYDKLKPKRQPELDKREKELLQFLELLFKHEFDLLAAKA